MTENEIVDYLKNNKTEGRIFLFMPEEVRKWCRKHYNNLRYYVYEDGIFESMNISNGDEICDKEIIGLPDDFKMEGVKCIPLSAMELFHTILALDNNLAHDHLASCHDVNTKPSLKRSLKKMIVEYIERGLPYGSLELESEEGSEYYEKSKEKKNE